MSLSAKNACGVYTDREVVELPIAKKGWRGFALAEVRVAETAEGWRAAAAFSFTTGNWWGCSSPITDHDTPFPTREAAIADAAAKLADKLSGAGPHIVEASMEAQRRKMIDWLRGFVVPERKMPTQLELFAA